MNNAERRAFAEQKAEYKRADNISFADLMKACRPNPRTKNLSETGGFNTAFDLLTRLRQRFYSPSDIAKAHHLLQYHALKQLDSETGADFVDREQKEYLALQQMGINVDDSLRLTKFIQQNTNNLKHQSLAQTIFTTPNMTLNKATSLFETYTAPDSMSVNAVLFCRYCKSNTHKIDTCPKKKQKPKNSQKKRGQKSQSEHRPPTNTSKKKQRFPCAICDSNDHLSYQCPRKADVEQFLSTSSGRWNDDEEREDA